MILPSFFKTNMKTQVVTSADAKNNPIIIESFFRETTRNGKYIMRFVKLALTHNLLMITTLDSRDSSTRNLRCNSQNILELRSLLPLDSMQLSVFKKSVRQVLKLCFQNKKYNRYFELENTQGSDELWSVWCQNVLKLKQKYGRKISFKQSMDNDGNDLNIFNKQWESQKFIWHDKYLYLGSKREVEDRSRPTPVCGLGPPEDIKILHLKPQYFGCWDQTEHWVQCESSKLYF